MNLSKTLSTLKEAIRGDATHLGRAYRVLEILRMRFGFQRLGVSEYIDYGLHNQTSLTSHERAAFLGYRRIMQINRESNDEGWEALTADKLTFCTIMRGLGLPHTPILAVLDPSGRPYPDARTLTSLEDAATYLRNEINYPFFVKPNHGNYGRGAIGVKNYDPETDQILRMDGKRVRVEAFLEGLDISRSGSQIFQDYMYPHPELAALCGGKATSVRVICGRGEGTPRLLSAVWKIPTGTNMMDNFMHGRSGNMLGAIQLETGRITRVVRAVNGRIQECETHPDTGRTLLGIRLPSWERIKELTLGGSLSIPGFRLHHWDLALTPEGPVFLEINIRGDMDLHQVASGHGIWTPALKHVWQAAQGSDNPPKP